jgi:hypothetical protein
MSIYNNSSLYNIFVRNDIYMCPNSLLYVSEMCFLHISEPINYVRISHNLSEYPPHLNETNPHTNKSCHPTSC